MAALTSALAVTHTAGAFQTALDRRQCGGETSRGVVCVARASARAQSALAGVSRPGRVVFSERRNAEGVGIRATARPRDAFSSDAGAWRGEAQRCDAAAAASEGDASGEVRSSHAHRYATHPPSLPSIHPGIALAFLFPVLLAATARRDRWKSFGFREKRFFHPRPSSAIRDPISPRTSLSPSSLTSSHVHHTFLL